MGKIETTKDFKITSTYDIRYYLTRLPKPPLIRTKKVYETGGDVSWTTLTVM